MQASLRRILSVVALAVPAVALTGCTGETGIVIKVDQGSLEVAPETLHFIVGVAADDIEFNVPLQCGGIDDAAQRFVRATDSGGDIVDVGVRDLAANPYRRLLRPGAGLGTDREVMVAVGAFVGTELVGYGLLDKPVNVLDGKVVEWQISLMPRPLNMNFDVDGCLCGGSLGDTGLVISDPNDLDCDQVPADLDCDDTNPWIRPGIPDNCNNGIDDNCNGEIDEVMEEVCNGLDDNCNGLCDEGIDADDDPYTECGSRVNACDGEVDEAKRDCNPFDSDVYPGAPEICDGKNNDCNNSTTYPDHEYCYTTETGNDTCMVGERWCDDVEGGIGWESDCQPIFDEAFLGSPMSCDAYNDFCEEGSERFDCAHEFYYEIDCELAVVSEPFPAPCPSAVSPVPRIGQDPIGCTWTLLGYGLDTQYDVTLIHESMGIDGPVVETCDPLLTITGFLGEAVDDHVLLWMRVNDEPMAHVRVNIHPRESANGCPPLGQRLLCTEQGLPPAP